MISELIGVRIENCAEVLILSVAVRKAVICSLAAGVSVPSSSYCVIVLEESNIGLRSDRTCSLSCGVCLNEKCLVEVGVSGCSRLGVALGRAGGRRQS